MPAGDEIRAQIQRHLITGDNRLKQGVSLDKARESYERALELARQAGLEDAVRPLVEIRLAGLGDRVTTAVAIAPCANRCSCSATPAGSEWPASSAVRRR